MESSDIRILICEDDESLGNGIAESFNRLGYQTTLVATAAEAKRKVKSETFRYSIIDCMLPDQNGVDLAKSFRLVYGSHLKIIFISGLFMDKKFIDQTLHSTQAISYLIKPFLFEDLLNVILQSLPSASVLGGGFQNIDRKKKLKKFNVESQIQHGFEIPFLLTKAMEGELSGRIELKSKSDEFKGTIHLHKGKILSVQCSQNKDSRLGEILKEKGFIVERELQKRLKENPKTFLGEYLIKSNSISPHSLQIVLLEQMSRRVGHFFQDMTYTVSIFEEENLPSDIHIDLSTFNQLRNILVREKKATNWLKNQIDSVSHYKISLAVEGTLEESFDINLISQLKEVGSRGETISEVLSRLDKAKALSKEVYPDLYIMLLSNHVKLQKPDEEVEGDEGNSVIQIRRLKELLLLYENQNHFERLNLDISSDLRDVQDAFLKISEALTYKRDSEKNYPEELVVLSRRVLTYLEESQKVLSNLDLRRVYISDLIEGDSTEEVIVDMSFGYSCILHEKYQQAFNIFSKMPRLPEYYQKWGLYLLWADVKCQSMEVKSSFMRYVGKELLRLPVPQDPVRHSHYYIVKGLYHMMRKEYKLACDCFEHAQSVDTSGALIIQKEIYKAKAGLKKERSGTQRLPS